MSIQAKLNNSIDKYYASKIFKKHNMTLESEQKLNAHTSLNSWKYWIFYVYRHTNVFKGYYRDTWLIE